MSEITEIKTKLNGIDDAVAKIDTKVTSLDSIVRGGDNPQDSLIALVHNTQKLINTIRNFFWAYLILFIGSIFYIGGEWFQFKITVKQSNDNAEEIRLITKRVNMLEIQYKGIEK